MRCAQFYTVHNQRIVHLTWHLVPAVYSFFESATKSLKYLDALQFDERFRLLTAFFFDGILGVRKMKDYMEYRINI